MANAALDGTLNEIATRHNPIFDLEVPQSCPNVPDAILRPRDTWRDTAAYDAQARKLAKMFHDNFKEFAAGMPENIRAAGPTT